MNLNFRNRPHQSASTTFVVGFAMVVGLEACASPGAACVSPSARPALAGRSADAVASTKTFATPESAIEHYVRNVAANDLIAAMQSCAIDDYATRFDFAKNARFIRSLALAHSDAPSNYAMYVQMNRIHAMANHAQATKLFAYGLLTDSDMTTSLDVSDAAIEAFILAADPAKLRALRIVRIDRPMQSAIVSPKVIALFKEHALLFGAEELSERIALYELGGEHHWSGFQLVSYGKAWQIFRFTANYAGPAPEHGIVGKTTPAEYEERLK